jgi:phage repressor protein C with HTH and peptisase S24 domain
MKTDNDGVAARYASVRTRAGLSKKAFAESLGIHPVVSGDIELAKRDPSRDVLVRLARVYGIDSTWLLTGERADRIDGSAGDTTASDSDVVYVDCMRQEAAAGRGAEIADWTEAVRIPVLRSFVAPRKPDSVRAVEVRGDSMTGIGLDDGDIVLFCPQEQSGDGVHVVSIGTQLLVKRIHFDPAGKRIHVLSENSRYAPRVLEGPELEDFRMEGRVVGWMHRH